MFFPSHFQDNLESIKTCFLKINLENSTENFVNETMNCLQTYKTCEVPLDQVLTPIAEFLLGDIVGGEFN